MGYLSTDLREMGYERTEKESPFDEDGILWSKGYEAICDQTGFVIREGENPFRGERESSERVYRYRNSNEVKLAGGYVSSYDWGRNDTKFYY